MREGENTSPSSGRFVVWSISPALGDRECFLARDDSVFFEIGFVAYNHDGYVLVVFNADDLLSKLGELGQAALACYGED